VDNGCVGVAVGFPWQADTATAKATNPSNMNRLCWII
jgi:hypothetical protein